jgi:thioredoxin 1
MSEVTVTEQNFKQEVLESTKPVIVDFWATWCGPCQMLGPIVAQMAQENPDIKVCKCNVDENPNLAQEFNVMSIPFIAGFKNGQLVNSTVGLQPKENLLALVK